MLTNLEIESNSKNNRIKDLETELSSQKIADDKLARRHIKDYEVYLKLSQDDMDLLFVSFVPSVISNL